MTWEVEAALRKMKNGKEAGKDQVNIETLKVGDGIIAKPLAKLYTKCITERRIPKTWKEANIMVKGNRKDIKNYRPICLLLSWDRDFVYIYSALFNYRSNLFYCAQAIGVVVCPFNITLRYAHRPTVFGQFSILESLYEQSAPVLLPAVGRKLPRSRIVRIRLMQE